MQREPTECSHHIWAPQARHGSLYILCAASLLVSPIRDWFLVWWQRFFRRQGSTWRGVAMCCSAFEIPLVTRRMCCCMLQCFTACSCVLQRVVISQQAERRNTPCHKGPAGNTRLCAPCLCHYAASLLLFCVVDSFSLCCSVLQCIVVNFSLLQRCFLTWLIYL